MRYEAKRCLEDVESHAAMTEDVAGGLAAPALPGEETR